MTLAQAVLEGRPGALCQLCDLYRRTGRTHAVVLADVRRMFREHGGRDLDDADVDAMIAEDEDRDMVVRP